MKNGDAYLFEDYEILRAAWWAEVDKVHSVEVLDAPGQGF
jgi:hypothetical protein